MLVFEMLSTDLNKRELNPELRSVPELGKKTFEALPNLKIVVRSGIGVDNIDLAAAKEHGVRVCNVPEYCVSEVADHAMTLLLASERKIVQLHTRIASGSWGNFIMAFAASTPNSGVNPITSKISWSFLGIVYFFNASR